MKSRKMKAFLLLGLLLLSLVFSGCTPEQGTTAPTQTTAPTEPTQLVSKYNNPMNLPDKLLDCIVSYLDKWNVDVNPVPFSKEIQIKEIKDGQQALHVAFDPAEFYYACGYFNATHEHKESSSYCCSRKYVWVKFKSADEIPEYYNGAEFAVAFQVNRALFVKDISSDEASVPFVGHYQLFTPVFVDGVNTKTPLIFEETLIYRTIPNQSDIYFTKKWVGYEAWSFPVVFLEDQYYIRISLYTIRPNGERYESNPDKHFGMYYAAIESRMITGKYSITRENGSTDFYGLISVDDFAKFVLK